MRFKSLLPCDLSLLETRRCTVVRDSASVGWLIRRIVYSILGILEDEGEGGDRGKVWGRDFVWRRNRIEESHSFELVLNILIFYYY